MGTLHIVKHNHSLIRPIRKQYPRVRYLIEIDRDSCCLTGDDLGGGLAGDLGDKALRVGDGAGNGKYAFAGLTSSSRVVVPPEKLCVELSISAPETVTLKLSISEVETTELVTVGEIAPRPASAVVPPTMFPQPASRSIAATAIRIGNCFLYGFIVVGFMLLFSPLEAHLYDDGADLGSGGVIRAGVQA